MTLTGRRVTDERIAEALEVSTATVARERRRFLEDGLEVALMAKKPGRPRRRILDGRTEAVLDLYEEPYDEKRPVVCFDERPCQLLADVRESLAPRPGGSGVRLVDHEYKKGGTANAHVSSEPLTGWRRVEVTGRRRKREFAEEVRRIAEEDYPHAESIDWSTRVPRDSDRYQLLKCRPSSS